MSSDVPIFTIGQLAQVKGGKRMPAGTALTSQKTSHPYLRIVDFKDGSIDSTSLQYVPDEVFPQIARYVISTSDLYISIVGTIGMVGSVPAALDGANLTENAAKICEIDASRVDARYLSYYLRSAAGQSAIRSLTVGSTQPKLALFRIEQIEVPCPAIGVQRAVADLLGALDDRITLLRETNATLEAIAQALFKSWFVDFDPVRAKRDGRAPVGMDEATAALFPDSFENSELGEVPKGWRLLPVADAYDVNPSRRLSKGVPAPYLDMANVPTQGFSAAEVSIREFGSGTKFVAGDTLLARITPCLENGKSAFVDFLDEHQVGWGSTEFVVLRPKRPLPSFHAYLLCRHQPFREHAIQIMSGTSGRQRIQNDVLGRYMVAVPSESVATAFGELVTAIHRKASANNAQTRSLASLRDTLLPRLISGQLRLPEAQAIVAEAA
ncbi:restriction endonuclease subunit S [Roseateles cellulosilyticus]|uniref:Restriction endonuclease subunit S n=1 Tax=Pelomonas cellulosilytica TaxID=2906762 RepID=A0ABS8XRV4_9BURK|nr:restriction endonuclease subunit S [Pelomonas sp. P8]MCE4553893.1 restriction endonuclease subunit S [Pelomonas sp. P8]